LLRQSPQFGVISVDLRLSFEIADGLTPLPDTNIDEFAIEFCAGDAFEPLEHALVFGGELDVRCICGNVAIHLVRR
jgi:hypothetical protein